MVDASKEGLYFPIEERWDDCLPVGFGGRGKNEENEEWLARVSVRICVWICGRKGQPGRRRMVHFYSDLHQEKLARLKKEESRGVRKRTED